MDTDKFMDLGGGQWMDLATGEVIIYTPPEPEPPEVVEEPVAPSVDDEEPNSEETEEDKTAIPVSEELPGCLKKPAQERLKDKVVNAWKCICGGGKTELLKKELHRMYSSGELSGVTLVASKTNDLSEQTGEAFINTYKKLGTKAEIINSRNNGNVRATILDRVKEEFHGVLFISHAALMGIGVKALASCHIYVDEIPNDLVKWVQIPVRESMKSTQPFLEWGWMQDTPDPDNSEKLITRMLLRREKMQEVVKEVSSANMGITTLNAQAIDLAEMLFHNMDLVHVRRTMERVRVGDDELEDGAELYEDENGEEVVEGVKLLSEGDEPILLLTGLNSYNLYKLIAASKSLTILAAELEDTVPGVYITQRFKVPINYEHTDKLPQFHPNPITVKPVFRTGKYTSGAKGSQVQDIIPGDWDKHTGKRKTIEYLIRHYSDGTPALMFLNNKDKSYAVGKRGIEVSGTQVHGMNNKTEHTKAIFLGSLIPTPIMMTTLYYIERDYRLPKGTLQEAATSQQSREACYQCVSRINYRKDSQEGHTPQHCTVIIPDQSYVAYMEKLWAPGMFNVDLSDSFDTKKASASKTTRQKRLLELLRIVAGNKAKPKAERKKMPEVLQDFGISNKTFCAWKNEFEDAGGELGELIGNRKGNRHRSQDTEI